MDRCCTYGGPSPVVDAVEELDTVGRRCVDTRKIGQLGEEGSLTFDVRGQTGIGNVTGGWGIRVSTTGIDDFEVAV